MLQDIKDNIKKLIKPYETIIIGLSGGPDSVFLLYILKELEPILNLKLIAVHLDHEWRENSKDDVLFCQNLCQKLNILFITKKASQINLTRKPTSSSKEEHARLLRRQLFESTLKEYNADKIALAQHADDQIETFFIRLLRGASISGLSAIRAEYNNYIRPLLCIKKSDILKYLKDNNISYMIDYTNESDDYLRNKIRKYIVPTFRDIDTRFDINFKKTLENIQNADIFIENITQQEFEKLIIQDNNNIWLDKEKFLNLYPYLHIPILIKWFCYTKVHFVPTNKIFKEILRFIKKPGSSTHQIYKSWSILKKHNLIKIEKI